MSAILMGKKIGMTRVFDENGMSVPVTIVQAGPCVVTQIKTEAVDGYDAVQLGYEDVKPRNSTMPIIGHDQKAGTAPKRFHREFMIEAADAGKFALGQALTVEALAELKFLDVVGTTKGKGFQGTMKRHNFKGMPDTHGTERKHRSPGSIGSHASNRGHGNLKKGKKMSGQMGNVRMTLRSVEVVRIDKENGLMLLKGPIPGAAGGMVVMYESRRLWKSKVHALTKHKAKLEEDKKKAAEAQ